MSPSGAAIASAARTAFAEHAEKSTGTRTSVELSIAFPFHWFKERKVLFL
jgi:hypothetical protein